MNYIIRLDCITNNGDQVWIKDVFGNEKKYAHDKSDAYKFISLQRAQSIAAKIISNHNFKPIIIKTI